ncbi:ammonium transporter [Cognataquiflexum aquatile]|uniref:ammonium transporter n=1 Tax=Cognataquiflexum aquatile TaxID=2249427 RepID=UPI000DE809B7|nr:ammonium transporter [Cognataquiflexum aquatile]
MKWMNSMIAQVSDVPAAVDVTAELAQTLLTTNNVWMMLCTAMVFIMHLGFAAVETGFGQAKNTVNILFKNTVTPIIGLITYAICGFFLMYPGFETPGWFAFASEGWSMFWFSPADADVTSGYASGGYTYWTDFLFQAMFAATCATIVSGAIAERVKVWAYLIFTLFFVGLIYPLIGSWQWGGGALKAMGFYDFAGSTLVHSVGGWGALAGVILVGPRIGKFIDGKAIAKPGASIPLAVIGTFLLWFGWFGFNGGSVLSANPGLVSSVLVVTCLGAAAGGTGGFLAAYFAFNRLDLGMVLNGILAGLVGITAGADVFTPAAALLIGFIAGILVVISAVFLDKMKLDDVVGAVSVHLTCGIWGTLAVGIFSTNPDHSFVTQLIGVAVCGATAFISAFAIFYILKVTVGIRVSEAHEKSGLDSHEHGIRGYTIIFDE